LSSSRDDPQEDHLEGCRAESCLVENSEMIKISWRARSVGCSC